MILSFSSFILRSESFDSTPVKWRKKNENEYWFQIDELIYDVNFAADKSKESKKSGIEVSFSVDMGSGTPKKMLGLAGTGNQFQVLSTVMDIWRDYIDLHPGETHYSFIANKTQSLARASVYEKLVKKHFSPQEWILHKEDSTNEVEFHLFRK